MVAQGGKLGHKIADIVTRAHYSAKRQYAPELVKLGMEMQHAFFTLTGNEHKATTGGLYRDLAATGKLGPRVQSTMDFLGSGHGQWQTLLAGQATGAAMGGGLMSVLQNELAPAIQELLRLNPNGVLAPADAASAVAKGLGTIDWGYDQANRGGLPSDLFDVLVLGNRSEIAPSDLVTLLNKGVIEVPEFQRLLLRAGYDPATWSQFIVLGEDVITPEDLAGLVTFGVLSQDDAAVKAGASGMNADDFALLVEGNGQPPGTDDLLFAYRRGIIDKTRLLRGITQGPVRNEWFDVIESLGVIPMATSDAIEAAVQGHLSQDAAKTIATQNGLDPNDFDALFATAGSPPGPEAMMTYLNRGFISEADATQALTESRLKPKYTDLILKSRVALLPMVQVREAFAAGVITHDDALQILAEHGYAPDVASIILAMAKTTKTTTLRQLTEAQVMALRTDRAITDAEATDMLEALNYAPDEVTWLFGLADMARTQKLMAAAINRVKASFLAGHIDDGQADSALDAIGVPPDQKTDLVTLWDIEHNTATKGLTLAQCKAALKAALIDQAGFTARVTAMGYSADDTQILLSLAAPPAAS